MFDNKKFMKTRYQHRTEGVPVPDLADYFEGDPVWIVRGLTGAELGRAAEAADRSKAVVAIIEALTSDSSKDKADAVKELMGIGGTTPQDIAKRIEHLVLGSVDPKCTMDMAVKLAETHPIEFYQVTNMIMKLTGMGQLPGKSTPSGETGMSAHPLPSVTSGGASSTKRDPTSSRKGS